jgi:hypothetical protein
MSKATASERLFARYLSAHGYEPPAKLDLPRSGGRMPDYRIRRGRLEAICEVKEFHKSSLPPVEGFAVWAKPGGGVREKVARASGQLRPFAGSGLPLVLVLANPRQHAVPLDPGDIAIALNGDPTLVVPLTAAGDQAGEPVMIYGRNGDSPDHLSAVLVLREVPGWEDPWLQRHGHADAGSLRRWRLLYERRFHGEEPPGHHLAVDVIETRAAWEGIAPPVPEGLFDGPHDRRFALDPGGVLVEASARTARR